ncbi:putative bifunctional diguanylate cyclase/phosphodiesterase [Nocardioides sp.]|jgi:diguanylate cyclase (GGDEF)-like protein|uniref:putative bifunctional diguanylate cyclase/phosphodiesterase n=1 Tax=Nocardioides sp. TaxID=35761 RepID=UPI002BBCD353|nr:EAL domain-containing protein [Nocardioides sp.]HVX55416.1 EAL domain-containing protein [Nocardioides sp.]
MLAIGVAVALMAVAEVVTHGPTDWQFIVAIVVSVPLIAVVARFPMVLDSGWGGVEVGFDSSILMFLVCTEERYEALVVWSAGVIATQLTLDRRASARVFNIGVGILAGGLATGVYAVTGGRQVGTPRELVAVALAAASYFVLDYVLSAISVVISSGAALKGQLLQRGTLLAIACFVPLDSLGYLGAVVVRSTPWWTLTLLGVPLITLLIATRAVTRGGENARRLTVLLGAAVRAQTLLDREAVVEALVSDARELLRLRSVTIRSEPPAAGEIAVEVQLGGNRTWLVARAMNRARSTIAADEQGLRALAAVASDAVARLELIEEKVHVARHDPLTDLPNRAILVDRLGEALTRARAAGSELALLFIDLDGFKPVNDRFGHAVGDAVLVQLATRLRACVGEHDTLARLGGDEFAILVESVDRAAAAAMCEEVLAAIEMPVSVRAGRLRLSASVGIAYGGRPTDTAAGLLRNADLAMYEAKSRGKGRCVEYEPAIGRQRLDRLELLDDLRRAVAADEIEVAYQPVVSVATGEIVGAEALARWSRGGAPVSPEVFIRAAEEGGLIVPLGARVFATVAADAPALQEAAGGALSIAVNISANQLLDPGFLDTVSRAAEAMPGTTLILEITERQGVDLNTETLAVMREIADTGVVFAIDDFGVGFSSISYLHDLPAGIIKADAALSRDIDTDARARALLRSVALMGRTLGFEVVIEGIERESQLDVVRQDAPETMAQGYLLHRPMPRERLLEVLAEARASDSAAR